MNSHPFLTVIKGSRCLCGLSVCMLERMKKEKANENCVDKMPQN